MEVWSKRTQPFLAVIFLYLRLANLAFFNINVKNYVFFFERKYSQNNFIKKILPHT